MRFNLSIAALMATAGLALAACAPVVATVDTPKEGQVIELAKEQPMRVRWANLQPDSGAWTLEQPPGATLTAKGVEVTPPANGARQLESFHFVAAAPGEETLTFAYKRKDGAPPTADERVTVKVKVSWARP